MIAKRAASGTYKTIPNETIVRNRVGGARIKRITNSTLLGSAPGDREITFFLELGIKNENLFYSRLDEIYTPGHPNFHKFYLPGEFSENHHPGAVDIAQTTDSLKANNIQVLSVSGRRMQVKGTVANIDSYFRTEIMSYKSNDGIEFVAPAYDLQIPSSLGVVAVHKLHTVPRKLVSVTKKSFNLFEAANAATFYNGPGINSFIRPFYNIPNDLDGSGQKVGIIGSDFLQTDVAQYQTNMGIGITGYLSPRFRLTRLVF